jgi:hypothetical protein
MPQTIEDYRRRMHSCITNADLSPSPEIRELWETIARSYGFLLAREERIEAQNLSDTPAGTKIS